MAYTFNQKNWVAGEVITANGVNRIEECLGHLVDEKQNILYFDAVPTAGSPNLVDSNGIYNAIKALDISAIDRRPTSNSKNAVQSRGIYEALLGKQDLLVFDSTPKSNSSNPVTSQGIYQALNLKQNNLTFDSTPISDSNNPVTSKGIYQALSLKQDNLTFDNVPDSGSNNPVTSSGIRRALNLKQDNLTFDSTPILNSSNPVTSEGIYISLQNLLGEVNNSLDDLSNSFYQKLITKQDKLTFDGIYNASTNKAATVSTVTNAIAALDGNLNGTTPGAGKTLTAFSETDGKVNATFGNISITKSQVSDLGTIGAAAAKGVDTSIAASSTSTNLPTSKAVAAFVEGKGYKTTDNNTTYSLTQDSSDGHKITLTSSSGTAQTITIPDNNTDTKVTSAANHYIPSRDTDADKSASASGATAAWSIDVVKGITVQTDGKGHVTGVAVTSGKIPTNPNTDTHRPIQVNGTQILGNNTTALNLKAGSNVSISNSSGTITIAATDTTYSSKTAVNGGTNLSLVTTGEKYIWNNIVSNVQSDWEDDDVESEAYIKNKPKWPTIILNEKYLFKNSYSDVARIKNDMRLWEFHPSETIVKQLIVGKKYIIQINDNIYEEYFQHAEHANFPLGRYYFVGSFFPQINVEEMWEKGFGIDFDKVDENSFQIREINFKEREIQKFSIIELLIGRQYLDMPDWSKELTKPNYSYNELTDLPTIPTKTSQLTNDSGFLTEITNKNVTDALGFTPLNAALRGVSGGVATLDENGIVPSSQLPAYVDTILEYNNLSNFPSIGESGKIYVALDTNKSYRWSGSQYTEISSSISLGEVQGTAYEGHKGKANALAINDLQNNKANKSTTISGYGIIDAKIENGIITLGNNTIQPIVDNNYNHTDNNFTNEEKNKLAQIDVEAEKNIQSDWNITNINSDAYIKNKPNIINTITENNNSLVTSGAIYTELIKKQNDLINVPEVSEIKSTDYIFIERNRTIYKILASKLGTFTPDESDPNAIETNDGNIITDENENEIIIDTNTTDTVETNDGKVILTEDQRELNLG